MIALGEDFGESELPNDLVSRWSCGNACIDTLKRSPSSHRKPLRLRLISDSIMWHIPGCQFAALCKVSHQWYYSRKTSATIIPTIGTKIACERLALKDAPYHRRGTVNPFSVCSFLLDIHVATLDAFVLR